MGRPLNQVPLEVRFWLKVTRADDDACWLWTGGRTGNGYGSMTLTHEHGRRSVKASHVAWFLTHGEWPAASMVVMHRCDNPPCVNPAHLSLGTLRDNMRDMDEKGRRRCWHKLKDRCINGHVYNASNTRYFGPRRICRVCKRMRQAKGYAGPSSLRPEVYEPQPTATEEASK